MIAKLFVEWLHVFLVAKWCLHQIIDHLSKLHANEVFTLRIFLSTFITFPDSITQVLLKDIGKERGLNYL